jgi:hypothetical protein
VGQPTATPAAVVDTSGQSYTQVRGFEISGSHNGIGNNASPFQVSSAPTNHHNCYLYNYVHNAAGDGIAIACTDYQVIYGNIVTANSQYATFCGSGITVYSPTASDSVSIFHDWVSHNESYGNFNHTGCSDGEGLILDDWSNSQAFCGGSTTKYTEPALADANLFYGNAGAGLLIYDDSTGGLIVARDNTSYQNQTSVTGSEFSCNSCNGTDLFSNDISETASSGNTCFSGGTQTYDLSYNGTPSSACGLASGSNNQQGVNPSFVTPGTDFHLRSGSAALAAGTNTVYGIPTTYLDGAAVPTATPDLGALGRGRRPRQLRQQPQRPQL